MRSPAPVQNELPAVSARAFLEGMSACGLSRTLLLELAAVDRVALESRDGMLPEADFDRLWSAAFSLAGRETLPLEVGLGVPYGAFGPLDFLAGTSETVAASLRSLCEYFAYVSPAFGLDVEEHATEVRLRIVHRTESPSNAVSDAFSLGVFLARYRDLIEGPFTASLEHAAPTPSDPKAFEAVAKTKMRFGKKVSAVVFSRSTYEAKLRSADLRLHETLRALASTLDLGVAATELEHAIRIRLRAQLNDGRFDQSTIARALGMSERTLQRRLEEEGRTFLEIVDAFRHEESLRILDDARLSLGEIARRLGFAEQSSFTRAFKRWTGKSPGRARPR
ncbi:AraC family transcriptional regulator [soil metagenome]